MIAVIAVLGISCSEKPKQISPVSAQEEAQERADYLKRAINEEKHIVEKFGLAFPEVSDPKYCKDLELKFNGLKKSNLVREFDLEYGIVRVNFYKWSELADNERKAITSMLSEYRYAKVKAQFLSVKRAEVTWRISQSRNKRPGSLPLTPRRKLNTYSVNGSSATKKTPLTSTERISHFDRYESLQNAILVIYPNYIICLQGFKATYDINDEH